MIVGQVLEHLGQAAPWDKSAAWDPVGLQLGDPGGRASIVAVCHEVTESVVAQVERIGVDLLVTYHPLIFRPTARLIAGRSPGGRAYRLIRQGTSLAVIHTNFDVAAGGVAEALADAIGLVATTGFGPTDSAEFLKVVTFVPAGAADLVAGALAAVGGGTIGNYTSCSFRSEGLGTFLPGDGAMPVTGVPGTLSREQEVRIEMTVGAAQRDAVLRALIAAHPYEEPVFDVYRAVGNLGMAGRVGASEGPVDLRGIMARVAEALGERGLRTGGDLTRAVETVAVVPGSGSAYIEAAAAAGADVLVTGDVTHHRMVEAGDRGLSIIDPGHLATERPGMRRLYDLVAGIVPEAVDLTNPADGEGN